MEDTAEVKANKEKSCKPTAVERTLRGEAPVACRNFGAPREQRKVGSEQEVFEKPKC